MKEETKEKTIETELRPFLRAEGWDFYMSLECKSGENADIFNVIDDMEFKLVVSWKDDEDEESEMEELFETAEWTPIEITTREQNGFEYFEGCLDVYALTSGGGYFSLTLSNCLSDVFPDIEDDDERNERVENLNQELIDNLTDDGDLDDLTEEAIVQYIKTYY